MGKSNGIIKIEGTLENLTFYKTQDGNLVRTKGGVSKKRIMKDPAFARTRENLNEFSASAQSGKLLRMSLNDLMQQAKDNRVTSRVTQVMSQILKFDTLSVRGQRKVSEGLNAPESKALLEGFNFNINAILGSVLKAAYGIDPATGEVSIPDLTPANDLVAPNGATHVSLRSAMVQVDFASGSYSSSNSPVENLPIDQVSSTLSLVPTNVPSGTGTVLILLLLEFFQEVNTVQYPLRNGAFNSLGIVAVV